MFESPVSKDFKKRKVIPTFDIEPQEILIDKLAQKKEKDLGISEKKIEVPLSKNILKAAYIISLALLFILFYRAFQLQVIQHERFQILAEENKFIIHQINATRGVIYDQKGNQLVFNRPSFDLVCKKIDLPEEEIEKSKILKEVSEILNEDYEILKRKIEESGEPQVLVSENISHQNLLIFETRIQKLSGFSIERNSIRDYKEGEIFAHLIGYTGKIKTTELKENPEFYSITDFVGRDGVEKSYEEALRKNPGKLRIERDALGNLISKEIIQFPESGKSLVLWLDSDLQKKIKEVLEETLKTVGAKQASAVALNPKTGGVLGLVSLPSFDNNLFSQGETEAIEALLTDKNEPLFNRVISGRYLTGSTIKPLIASAALEENIINPKKRIDCQGLITIPHQYDPEKEFKKYDWRVHGWTDMKKAIAESCNVYFYTVGGGYQDQEGLGPTKIKEYLELFNWSEIAGIDLPGEMAGFIPDKEWKKKTWNEGWWDGDTYNLSIGQGYLLITPLEVAASFASIANGGQLMQPQVVKDIVDISTDSIKVLKEFTPKVIRENFISPENLQVVREGMRQSVTGVGSPHASAVLLNSLPVSAAAKTGTAELGKDFYHNWITVFAPYDEPEIVLTVIIENIKGIQTVALPAAKEILEWHFTQ